MSLSPQFLDELRSRLTLSTIIGRTVRVQRAGREFKACCPFHHEKTPSFTINDDKGFYHCFGCGAHGDAIRWMTDQRGLPFMDAVKELAAEAGLDLPAPDPRAARKAEAAKTLRDVTAAAAAWFTEQLGTAGGADARAYLERRALSAATIREFGFGFAPDSRTAVRGALKEFPVPMLVESGMLIAVDDKEPYDRFRGRIMIPIRDVRGRVIAFGGRILGAGEPKYLNSPDTPLFDKGRVLYNLDRAAPASRQTGRMIVAEGYMDVIALAQAGFADAVAPLGTALTEAQLGLLWRHVNEPILCFDGDAAGQKAAMRAALRALPLLRPGYSLRFATLPPGQDPDDVVRTGGPAAFQALLAAAEPLVERLWASAVAEGPLDTPEQRAALKQRLEAQAATIGDTDVAYHYRAAFRERLDALFAPPPRGGQASPGPFRPGGSGKGARRPFLDPAKQPALPDSLAVRRAGVDPMLAAPLLGGLLRYPDVARAQIEQLEAIRFADRADNALLKALIDAIYAHPALDQAGLFAILETTSVYNRASKLMRADGLHYTFTQPDYRADPSVAADHLAEMIAIAIEWPELDTALADATRRAGETFDEADFAQQRALLAAKEALVERLAGLRSAARDDE